MIISVLCCRINLQTSLVINQRSARITVTCRRGDGLSDRLQISETDERSAEVWREQQHKALICDLYTLWPHTHTHTHTHTQLRILHHRSVMFDQIVSDCFKVVVVFSCTIPESVRNNKPTFTSSGCWAWPGVIWSLFSPEAVTQIWGFLCLRLITPRQ